MTETPTEERATGPALVIGLGNPGERYRQTRHNLGFQVVERLAREEGVRFSGSECNALVGTSERWILAMPQTFMNRSGFAARCLVERYDVSPDRCLVVYDETHLPLGRLRLRESGGPAGHRGMESVLRSLRTDSVPRLRMGVGGEELVGDELVEFVLDRFAEDELEVVDEMVARAVKACDCWLSEGAQAAMTRYNQN